MNRVLRSVVGFLTLSVAFLGAQGAGAPAAGAPDKGAQEATAQAARKTGTIFKAEVDGVIRLLRQTAGGGMPLGRGSVLDTAKILVAMGHCHRRYHESDGPVVRPSLAFLIRSREADGSFDDAAATAWVIDAFERIAPGVYAEEVAQARTWVKKSPEQPKTFADAVAGVIGGVRANVWPEHLAGTAPAKARQWLAAPETLDREDAVDVLVTLVACQVANRQLDRAEKQQAGSTIFTKAQEKAFAFVLSQHKRGVFMNDPAMTGFGLLALQTKPKTMRTADEQEVIDKGLRWLCEQQNEDGTIGEQTPNYSTCIAVAALSRWDDTRKVMVLERAQKAILAFQNIEDSGYQRSDRDYGSIGYGGSQRGDLSNLQFSLQALKESGLDENHEAFAKALVFLQRTQNLKSHNDFSGKVPDPENDEVLIDATSGEDGGACYYPGNSNAGYIVRPDGKSIPRSYGSMTYALLKAYIFAGLPGTDPRVQAAVGWVQKNWDLATNPGADPALGEKVKYQGLFYYYMVLAQALDAAGLEVVEVSVKEMTTTGEREAVEEIDWREALRKQLEGMQQADGSWVNGKNPRWWEGMPLLCTCYAMVALERTNG